MKTSHTAFALLLLVGSACPTFSTEPSLDLELLALRDAGFAELENERPEQAEEIYRQLIDKAPDDPLGHANLAISQLRQQKYDAGLESIARAQDLAPGRGDLLAIEAEILQWKGDLEGALRTMDRAARAAPEDPEILYSAYQIATTLSHEASEPVADFALRRLVELRPENLVVLLQSGQKAIAENDRAAATGAYLRIAQLLWQVDDLATRALKMVNDALRQGDLAAARVPALRLENVLKISPMFRESLRELKTGIQGIPLRELRDEPRPTAFGQPIAVGFHGTRLDDRPTRGRALAFGDFDGDGKPDLARIRASEVGGTSSEVGGTLEIRRGAAGWKVHQEIAAKGLDRLLATDLDNDGSLDLVATGPEGGMFFRGAGDGTFTTDSDRGLGAYGGTDLAVVDFDIEGDLDLVVSGPGVRGAELFRNNLSDTLEAVGDRSLPSLSEVDSTSAVTASDLDRDGDLDLVLAHARGLTWLDNLRQGRFIDRSSTAGLPLTEAKGGGSASVLAADFDNDGFPELVTGGAAGAAGWHNDGGRFTAWTLGDLAPLGEGLRDVIALDADNDGRKDLAAVGTRGPRVLLQQADGSFSAAAIEQAPAGGGAVAASDLDQDGDQDLVVAGEHGLHWLENRGGNRNHWLTLSLRGLDKGNSKNNLFGVGSVVEVRSGDAYQFYEAAGDVLHLGLGDREQAEVVRVVWTNGVPQNRLQLAGNQRVVEEQLLKGSCPFLYTWDGERMAFVTDLLWGAPLGLPVAPGAWASSDPSELVKVEGLRPRNGKIDLRITEELWEAAFFDYLRLWVVDHPADVEVASSLRIVPGETLDEKVFASRRLRPVAAARDGSGRDVTEAIRHRDEVYADGYRESAYQGVAAEPWAFTFDLGEAPNDPVRLHMDGWIFPSDASLNLAVAQRSDLHHLPPVLEVETRDGWQPLLANFGFPAGKTKTLVVDLPPLPEGAQRLRLRSSLWLHWDRIAWTSDPADGEAVVRARLEASRAELRYRGFSAMYRTAPNGPHVFDYERVRLDSPWLPFPGGYTRFGDVRPLLQEADDFSVVLAPGDEMALEFDDRHLPEIPTGWQRTYFLESHGWDKDADRNTFEAQQLEPRPFRAMSGYPFAPGEAFPRTPAHDAYRQEWLTRQLP